MYTTLNQIRKHSPCTGGWKTLLKALGKTDADDVPVSIVTILDSNGLNDAIWCLRAVEGHAREIRLYAVWCARQVEHLMRDTRSKNALDIAERFANGEVTAEELRTAKQAAAYAYAAAYADAAYAAAYAADAAAYAADAAAYADAAYAAAYAYAAADAAADAYAAAAAADAADAADAARVAMRAKQEQKLRELCSQIERQIANTK